VNHYTNNQYTNILLHQYTNNHYTNTPLHQHRDVGAIHELPLRGQIWNRWADMESAPTSYSRMTNHGSRLLVHRPPINPSTHPPVFLFPNHESRIPNQLGRYGIGGRIWNPPLRAIHESPFLVYWLLVYWLLVHYSSLFLFTVHCSLIIAVH